MPKKTANVLDKVVELSIYCLVFIIPFSKAGIEIFATAAIAAWLVKKVLRIKDKGLRAMVFPQSPLNNPIAVLFAVYLISMFFSTDINLSLRGVFSKLAEYFLIFFVCTDTFSRRKESGRRLTILLVTLLLSVILLFTDAGFQWVYGEDFIRGFKMAKLRACFSNANDFAGYIIAILPVLFCMAFLRFKKSSIFLRLSVKFSGIILYLAGLILLGKTLARGAWLSYLASMAFLAVIAGFMVRDKSRRVKRLTLLIALSVLIPLIMAGIFVKPVRERLTGIRAGFEASVSRRHQWREAVEIIKDFPILGAGPNTYTAIIPKYSLSGISGCYPHNCYLHMAAETGILGLGAFLWVLWALFRRCVFETAVRRSPPGGNNYKIILLGVMAGITALLVQSIFDTNLFALKLVTLFWIMMGVAVSACKNLGLDTAA